MERIRKFFKKLEDKVESPEYLEIIAEGRIGFLYNPKKDEKKLEKMISQLKDSEKEYSYFFFSLNQISMRLRFFYLKNNDISKSYEISQLMARSLRKVLERNELGDFTFPETKDRSLIETYVKYWEDIVDLGDPSKSLSLINKEIQEKTKTDVEKKRFDNAITKLKRILEEKKKTGNQIEIVTTLQEIARVMKKNKNLEGALEYYRIAANIDPKTWFEVGFVLGEMQEYKESISAYNEFLKIYPKDTLALNNIGWCWENLKIPIRALEVYDEVIKLDPKNRYSWNGKGNALHNLGRYEEAIECYDKAIKLDPKAKDAWNNKGIALDNLGRYEEAIECYDKVIELDPKYQKAWNNRSISLAKLGREAEAE